MNARDLRRTNKATKGMNRQPCYVCCKHQSITELHHVFSLKDCAMVIDAVGSVNVPMAWLCPNCHTYIHQAYKGIFFNAKRELQEDEYSRMLDLINLRSKAFDEVIREVAE